MVPVQIRDMRLQLDCTSNAFHADAAEAVHGRGQQMGACSQG